MKLNQINEAMNHQITGGSEYQWQCFPDARFLDYESEYAHVTPGRGDYSGNGELFGVV